MSTSNPQNRGSYNLRPRSKAVISVKSRLTILRSYGRRFAWCFSSANWCLSGLTLDRLKRSLLMQRNNHLQKLSPGIKKKTADREKPSFAETESPGQRCLVMNREELKKYIHDKYAARGVIHKPPTPLSDEERARMREKNNLRLAETGLSYLNDPANGDAKYELVNPIAGRFFISCNPRPRGITHSNFEAKLKNDPEAEVQLFFLEIVEKPHGIEKVTCCCSLGRSGSKAAATGLHGCKVCAKINHPKRMRFITR